MAPTMVANVKAFVNKNRRVTLEEVANKFSIGKALAQDFTRTLRHEQGKCQVGA
jgi:ribosomal protein S25